MAQGKPLAGHDSNWFSDRLPGRRVIYLCDWLPPDFGAVGQYSLQFACDRAEQGEDVLLVGFSSAADSIETERFAAGRLTVWRMRVRPYDKSSLLRRLLWTAGVNGLLFRRLLFKFWRADEIVFTGSPPFMVHWVAPLGRLMRNTVVYRITDFYPECIMAASRRPSLLLRLLLAVTVFWRKRVSVLEVLGEDQRQRLREAGIAADRTRLKRDPCPVIIDGNTVPVEIPEELAGRFVLLYSGNLGVAHDVNTFAEAYIDHHQRGSGRVGLWLNAVGSGAAKLAERLQLAGVPVVVSRPVPLEQLPSLLIAPDAHLITLKDEFVGYVMPSKVYGCIESGKAVLYIGPQSSDVHLLCSEQLPADQYRQVPVGEIGMAFQTLEAFADSRRLVAG
jgi:hypothetical protein